MSSLGEVQRIIGLSLNKIQMGRNQRGGLPLHKNLLVATVLNKARDVYMQETMYMNYRLMACGQFNQEGQDDIEEDDTPETEDYEEDSESDVEEDVENSVKKDYVAQNLLPCLAAAVQPAPVHQPSQVQNTENIHQAAPETSNLNLTQGNSDEGFIDESDCDCDRRNFCQDSENRVPFQYCFNCAPFHPSNGRGPTLVGPQSTNTCVLPNSVSQEQEDKLIYDMDSKSTRNQSGQSNLKRKRLISVEETEDAIISILPKRKRNESENEDGVDLNDSGFQDEAEEFHPAFRGHRKAKGMEVEQITSLVSIFSFGQQLFNSQDSSTPTQPKPKKGKEDEDSDSDSDTSSDSGHSSDDHEINSDEKGEERGDELQLIPELSNRITNSELRCSPKDADLDVSNVGVTTAV
ncbi:uncharacterized protein LOC111716613 [Eurytemora carolleeae]|uniref:uncharacterized protein LOC111716613 n=1 Tax=Eurytemora carolleeae TaxID=1294199 RepID=UPI000C75FD24|nr:uncharacterized protein LOC111716613 [Eurytemora carolleeae]|eukprot:XP_023347852.1 uncharacterized protein LOC111716613 [Eurytemora affinis]